MKSKKTWETMKRREREKWFAHILKLMVEHEEDEEMVKGSTREELLASGFPAEAIDAALRMKAAEDKEPVLIALTGKVQRVTEKAILFSGQSADGQSLNAWFPKSQVDLSERSMGGFDQLHVPEWLFNEKMKEA